jgi:hypothetical protein
MFRALVCASLSGRLCETVDGGLSQTMELWVEVSDFLNRLVHMLQAIHDLELKSDRFVSLFVTL